MDEVVEMIVDKLKAAGRYEEAKAYALISDREHLSPFIRMAAVNRLEKLIDEVDPPPAKPSFKWVNGAKVKC